MVTETISNPLHNEKGIVLAVSLLLLAVLVIIGTTAVQQTTTDIKISGNYKSNRQAFYDAEAGVHYALAKIADGLTNSTFTLPTAGNPVSLSSFTASGFNFSLSNMEMVAPNKYFFTSTATLITNANASLEVTVERMVRRPISYAAFGDTWYDGRNSQNVYSYDHRSGPQPGDPGFTSSGEGDIGSNGEIILHNSAYIDGQVGLGAAENDPDDVADFTTPSGGYIVTADPETQEMGWVDPDPLGVLETSFSDKFAVISASNDNASLGLGTSLVNPASPVTLTGQAGGANYYFTEIHLYNSDIINIDASAGPVNIYLDGRLELNNAAKINVSGTTDTNVVTINVNEPSGFPQPDIVNFKNGSEVNVTGSPTHFSIFSNSDKGVRFHNSSEFKGLVYAPDAEIEMNNSSDAYGAFWGDRILMHNSADLYYDVAMMDKYTVLSNDLSILSWRDNRN